MIITLDLPPEMEARLRRKAEQEGKDIAAYLLAVADREAQEEAEGSAYDLFAGRIGRIKDSTEALSQNTGERFTEHLVEKHRAGHL